MKLKQKLLIVSALSGAAIAAIGYLTNNRNKEEIKPELIEDSNKNCETDTKE